MSDETSRPFHVLAVDDEAPIREFVTRVLAQAYDVSVAADGDEAVRLAETRGPFDLLVTDMMMPQMRGDELARRLRQATPDIKVLYLTGFSDQLFEARSMLWEGEAFLEKPIGAQGLLEAVALLLVGHVPAPRAPRVLIPGARIRCGGHTGTLESLSVTGTRGTFMSEIPDNGIVPLVLEFPADTVRVTAKVASREPCAPAAAVSNGEAATCAVAFAFVNPSASVRVVLERLISEAAAASA